MADEPFVGSRHLIAVDDAFRAIGSGNSAELQPSLLVFKKLPDINLAHVKLFQS